MAIALAIAAAVALAGGSLGVVTGLPGFIPSSVLQADVTVVKNGVTIVSCGYPIAGGTPLQQVAYSESEVLRNISATKPDASGANQRVSVFYNDEHALAVGVSKVTVNGVVTDYTSNTLAYPGAPPSGGFTPVKSGAPYYTPGHLGDDPATVTALNLAIHQGTQAPAGVPGSSDASGRPLGPTLFVTDLGICTTDQNNVTTCTNGKDNKSGDWQSGGTPIQPSVIYGSWKYFTETITNTTVNLTGASDPTKNNWTLGAGSDIPDVGFAALKNEGYGAEIAWDAPAILDPATADASHPNGKQLLAGHTYRFEVMDHDGDQNKTGGDSGVACANVVIANPKLQVTKSNDVPAFSFGPPPTGGLTGPTTIHYSYLVENIGNVEVTNIVVTDDKVTSQGGTVDCAGQTTLAVGANMTCHASYVLDQAGFDALCGNPGLHNIVTVDSSAPEVTDNNTIHANCNPAMTLTKDVTSFSGDITHKYKVNEISTYKIVAKNTGNQTLTTVTVKDVPNLDNFTCDKGSLVANSNPATWKVDTLAPNDSITCTGSHTVTQADVNKGDFLDTASAHSNEVSPPDAQVDIHMVDKRELTVTKVPTPGFYGAANDVITYTYTVKNTGDVTLHDVTLADTKTSTAADGTPGAIAGAKCTPFDLVAPGSVLQPGDLTTCTATYTIKSGDIPALPATAGFGVDNTGTATGKDPANGTVTGHADAHVGFYHITLTKTPDPDTYSAVGQVITYTYVVLNDGGVTLFNVLLKDDKTSSATLAPGTDIPGNIYTQNTTVCTPDLKPIAAGQPGAPGGATLAVGASATCTGVKYNIVAADITNGKLTNVALATASVGSAGAQAQAHATASATSTALGPCVLGYPYTSANAKTSITFNESTVLKKGALITATSASGSGPRVGSWYSDEHALRLGVSKFAGTDFPGFSNYAPIDATHPYNSVTNPNTGYVCNGTANTAGCDAKGRPIAPAAFTTDLGLTSDPNFLTQLCLTKGQGCSGDWQFGGSPITPSFVGGTWKGSVQSATGAFITDTDPTANGKTGLGEPDVPPGGYASLKNLEAYGAEAVYSTAGLLSKHVYRFQFMVHDGDGGGGDVGQACVIVRVP